VLPPPAAATPISTADIVAKIRPSVVHVQVDGFSGPGTATGVVLDTSGRILTNQHVVDDARQITVTLSDDRVFQAEVVGEDPAIDIAVLRIDPEAAVEPPRFGDAKALRVGDDVVAIGHALALRGGPTVSKGVVSALDRSIDAGRGLLNDLIQTDASINAGNSGGPLVNMRGEVIGINVAEVPGERIGFAITINVALEVARRLIVEGDRPTPDIGFVGINITPALAQIANLPVRRGVGIVDITRGGPADQAGLKVDDIIVQVGACRSAKCQTNDSTFESQVIRDLTDLARLLRQRDPGDTVYVTLIRGQDVYQGPVVLGEQAGSQAAGASATPPPGTPRPGTPTSGTPIPGTPVPGTPAPGTPVSGTPTGTPTGGTR
jgi:serine protease Do